MYEMHCPHHLPLSDTEGRCTFHKKYKVLTCGLYVYFLIKAVTTTEVFGQVVYRYIAL